MYSDQMGKHVISESMIQGLYLDIVGKGSYYGFRDDMLSHLVTIHQSPGASCGILYALALSPVTFY